jgi:hypothetical protein
MDTGASNKPYAAVAVVVGVLTATVPTCLLARAVTFLCVIPLVLGVLSVSFGVAALRPGSALGKVAAGVSLLSLLAAVAVPFGLIAYDSRSGHPIVLVVPDDYRGPLLLVIDREHGVDVPLRDGVYEYRMPDSGRMLIRGDEPFRQWHSFRAVYAGGKPIPMADEGDLPPDLIALHSLGSGMRTGDGTTEEFIEFFVGTQAGLKKHAERH